MIAFAAALLLTQYPSVESPREPLPAGYPRTDAIPRQFSELDPTAALEKLRKEGILPWSGKPTQARLLIQNMDADDDPEYVLVAEIDGKWWTLGTLMSRLHEDLDTFVSLKPLVWPGTYDLVIQSGGSQGTGVGEITKSVYRILRGNLYKVFEEVEGAWNLASTESATFEFGQPITVRQTRKRHDTGRESKSCAAYRWNPQKFAFLQEACR